MNIEHIAEFAVLAQVGNYLEASELLFISQSTLSKHIQSMERELGVRLFDRSTRRIALTEEGRTFLPYAKKIATLRHEYTVALEQTRGTQSLTIGSLPIMAPYGITSAIMDFQHDNPHVQVRIVEGDAAELKSAMRAGELEVAFIRDDGADEREFRKMPFAEDHLVAVLRASHPLARRDSIQLEELSNEFFLLLPAGSVVHTLAVDACVEHGFSPHIIYTGQRAENILDLVARGAGVSLLTEKPTTSLVRDNDQVVLVDVTPPVRHDVCVFTLRDAELSEPARRFIDYIPYHDFFRE